MNKLAQDLIQLLKDDIHEISMYSVNSDDIFNEEVDELNKIVEKMKEKVNN
jgi:hypothetical protein